MAGDPDLRLSIQLAHAGKNVPPEQPRVLDSGRAILHITILNLNHCLLLLSLSQASYGRPSVSPPG